MLIRSLEELPKPLRGGAVAIGNFDGVHQGHARLVERLVSWARQEGGAALVFTFDPAPAWILHPATAPLLLCWTERKAELLTELGVDAVVAYPTTAEFLHLEGSEFFWRFIVGELQAKVLVESSNFAFGRGRQVQIPQLESWCRQAGIRLEVVPPVEHEGRVISSSWIRHLLAEGQVEKAAELLGRPYRIRGQVVRGAGRGRQLGYPTLNLRTQRLLIPAEGIYAGRAFVGETHWPAAISVGTNPTFGEKEHKIEAFLIGFEGDLYDRTVELEFVARLREVRRFSQVHALVAQMAQDVEVARQILTQSQVQETRS